RRTCHTANIYVSSIYRILSAYFTRDEVDSFRNLQAVTGMVISGSSALQFFNREVYDTNDHRSDLDTYCVLSKCDAVGDWLLSHNYEYQPQRNQLPCFADDWKKTQESKSTSIDTNLESERYPSRTFASVWNFIRDGRTVQVIAVKVSVVESILSFHSTCVMNIITHRAAYCLFAKATL
ncbi:hypothetical protein C8R42DRAFT_538107, partial [Lentinula raphanica]